MDVAMLSHSISNILEWMNSLKTLENKLPRIDIKQLEKNIREINDKVQKQCHSESLLFPQPWLQMVKEVLIDLNDLMEDLRQKKNAGGLKDRFKSTLQVKKATDELKRLLNEADAKGAAAAVTTDDKRKSECKFFEEITKNVAVGRENEKKKIIDQLLNLNSADADAAVPVIAIVGVAGIGKTKLAHLVCDDAQVKENFEFEQVSMESLMDETLDVESSHQIPHHEVPTCTMTTTTNGKRRLVIINDLRIETNKHDDLKKLPKKLMDVAGGRTNTAILITTRSNHVANNIGATHVLKLQGLNQKESLSLFDQIQVKITSTEKEESTIEPESKPEPEQGWDIMRDCGGVPLLIVIVATLMKKQKGGGGAPWIPEALKMLKYIYYEDLPTYQKLCLAYCSLFPEDYLIDAERLIQLWTAEGFLVNTEQQFGQTCFEDFVPLVFHQTEEESDLHRYCGFVRNNMNNYLYKMNRLMHQLARREITGNENITVDVMGERVQDGMLRISLDFALDLSCEIPDLVFQKARKLRTILLPYNINNPRLPHEVKVTTSTCDKIFDSFKCSLRVLDLHDLGIKTVPSSIEDVKYLRYLDLSHNNIEKLPSCITNLIHLQTLKLSQCHVLKELPKDMDDLSCLNHLDLEGCLDLTQMPSGINKLTSLQTLSLFVASKKQVTGGLRSLTDLNNLRGHLEISHLEQVKFSPSKEAAKDDFLKNKQHLKFLTLRWDHEEEEESNVNIDNKFIDCLEPHRDLEVLLVVGYHGHVLSNWLASLQYLVKFTLNDCPNCEFLPPMDQLPNLKVLQLRRLDSLTFIAKNNHTNTPKFFPSLMELAISDCPKLKSWWEKDIQENDRPSFRCISKLNIQYCPQLACMPLYPGLDKELVLVDTMHHAAGSETTTEPKPFSKLKFMVVERIDQSPPESWLKHFISLEELHIRDYFNLTSLPQGFRSLSSLTSLSIERCEQLVLDIDKSAGTEWEGLKSLRSLTLRSIPKLKSLPGGVENVKTLKDLRIFDCHGLTSLPESIGNLTSLEKLVLSECRKLDSLPKGMEKLQSLNTLIIMDCPLLLPRCQPDTGDDWPQIAHIINKLVKETPQDLMDHL